MSLLPRRVRDAFPSILWTMVVILGYGNSVVDGGFTGRGQCATPNVRVAQRLLENGISLGQSGEPASSAPTLYPQQTTGGSSPGTFTIVVTPVYPPSNYSDPEPGVCMEFVLVAYRPQVKESVIRCSILSVSEALSQGVRFEFTEQDVQEAVGGTPYIAGVSFYVVARTDSDICPPSDVFFQQKCRPLTSGVWSPLTADVRNNVRTFTVTITMFNQGITACERGIGILALVLIFVLFIVFLVLLVWCVRHIPHWCKCCLEDDPKSKGKGKGKGKGGSKVSPGSEQDSKRDKDGDKEGSGSGEDTPSTPSPKDGGASAEDTPKPEDSDGDKGGDTGKGEEEGNDDIDTSDLTPIAPAPKTPTKPAAARNGGSTATPASARPLPPPARPQLKTLPKPPGGKRK